MLLCLQIAPIYLASCIKQGMDLLEILLSKQPIQNNQVLLKSNPIARWHIYQNSINDIAFSTDVAYLATVGRDGYLHVFDYQKEQLICGEKSYYGALLCCAWRW